MLPPALLIFWTAIWPASEHGDRLRQVCDPLADKLLTTVAFIYMMRDGVCSPVVLCIILAREFAVSGLRMVLPAPRTAR